MFKRNVWGWKLVLCLMALLLVSGGMAHAYKASDFILKPIPVLDKLVAAGKASGIDTETGFEALFGSRISCPTAMNSRLTTTNTVSL